MAVGRMIHRDFATSADLEDLPATGRLLFAMMIVYADNAGEIRHHPRFFRDVLLHGLKVGRRSIDDYLEHLRRMSCISPVDYDGVKCWRITNFARFQRLNRREGKMKMNKSAPPNERLGGASSSRQKAATPPPDPPGSAPPPAEVVDGSDLIQRYREAMASLSNGMKAPGSRRPRGHQA